MGVPLISSKRMPDQILTKRNQAYALEKGLASSHNTIVSMASTIASGISNAYREGRISRDANLNCASSMAFLTADER